MYAKNGKSLDFYDTLKGNMTRYHLIAAYVHTHTHYIYISSSSSSSYRAGSTDIPDPLSPLLPIVHRPR